MRGWIINLKKSFWNVRIQWDVTILSNISDLKEIKAGVPQGSVLGPSLYLLYTSDVPMASNNTIATFADGTLVLSVAETIKQSASTTKLHEAVNHVIKWTKKWCIKWNEMKLMHVDFTNKKIQFFPHIMINGNLILHSNIAKYLSMTLDVKLQWKEHIKKK